MKEPKNQRSKPKFLTGITGRWFRTTLLVVLIVMLLFGASLFLIVRNIYYSNVDAKLKSQYSDSVENLFTGEYAMSGEAGFEAAARQYVEDFDQKDNMAVWVIDQNGNVLVSSLGFGIDDKVMPDYKDALRSDTRSAAYSGKNANGEHINARTYLINNGSENIGAVRYMISMRPVHRQVALIALFLLIVIIIMILLVVVSGVFFINTIVEPVKQINDVTKKIASGDMEARMPPQEHDDEISELCDNINHMADELSSTDKMKNDFISTVSHEMKTPLTAIKGWAETLSMGGTDEALLKRGFEVIIDESTRLTNVVNDLLDLSKIVNGRLTLKYEKIDILAELDESIFFFKDRSMREGIDLIYNAPHVPAPAEGDPNRIKQVFENILDNAFKYNRQGGKVTVMADVVPPENGEEKAELKIYVEDTGCGISKEELPNVKKKFYKSNLSVRGSGIGLAVCDEIIRMHNGTLDVQSEVGVGTCIIMGFPVDYVPVETDDAALTTQIETENEALGKPEV